MKLRERIVASLAVVLVSASLGCFHAQAVASNDSDLGVLFKGLLALEEDLCTWKANVEQVRTDLRTAMLADLAEHGSYAVFSSMVLMSLWCSQEFATSVLLDPSDQMGWACVSDLYILAFDEMRALGKEEGVLTWERGFGGVGTYFEHDGFPVCKTFLIMGVWLPEGTITHLGSYTVLRLFFYNVTDSVVTLSPSARVLLVDDSGRQNAAYTAFDPPMVRMLDQPFYRQLWGQQLTVYPNQYIEVYLPFDKVTTPSRLIFENMEGRRSAPFYLDLLF